MSNNRLGTLFDLFKCCVGWLIEHRLDEVDCTLQCFLAPLSPKSLPLDVSGAILLAHVRNLLLPTCLTHIADVSGIDTLYASELIELKCPTAQVTFLRRHADEYNERFVEFSFRAKILK